MKTDKQEIHVLMVSFSALGHVNPMLRLGKRLVSSGLHVTLATTELARAPMSHSTTTTTSADGVSTTSLAGINLEFYSDGLSLDYDRNSDMNNYIETLAKHGPVNLSPIIQNHSPKFSCIINNPFVPWVADVAAQHGIPCHMLWIQPCTLYAIYYRFYNNLNPFPTSTNPEMSVELPGLPLLETGDLPSFILPSNPHGSLTKLFSEVFQNMKKKIKWVLANSFHELEQDVIESMNEVHPIRAVGPLVPASLLGEDEELDISVNLPKSEESSIEWLNQQHPSSVIYISFGSLIELSQNDMANMATALKNTKRPFLWVLKLKGDEHLPADFLEETKDEGKIVQWCPQIKVLSHPSLGCFITHCGWNSLLETITAGVPVIAYPKWTDQPTNAKLVVDVLKFGVRLKTANQNGELCSEEVEKCIEEIMGQPEYKENANKLKMAAREAVDDGGSSVRNIQLFVDDIVRMSCS